jgi:hypothetical protein
LRQATAWSIEEAKRKAAEGYCDWKPAAIKNFEVVAGTSIIMVIQLVNSEALYEEGYEMSHCVADYADDCADGMKAIFSVRKYADESGFETLATVCVFLEDMAVYEAQARYNEMISKEAHEVIQQWAAREKLKTDYDYYDYENVPSVPEIAESINNDGPFRYENVQRRVAAADPHSIIVGRGISSKQTWYIIFFMLKMLWLIAKCSQAG